jgi:hypothetical protein
VAEELGAIATVGEKLGDWEFFRPFDGQTVSLTNYAVTLEGVHGLDDLTLGDEHTEAQFVGKDALPQLDVKNPSIFKALGE